MNKIFILLACLALVSFTQDTPTATADVAVQPLGDQTLQGNGEVVTQNVQLEVETLIPQQEAPPGNTIVNVGEVVNINQVPASTENVNVVEQSVAVQENVVVEQTPAPVEQVTVVEENVVVQQGAQPDTVVQIGEVVVVEEAAPVVQEVNLIEQTVVVDENIVIPSTQPPVTSVNVVEENIVIRQPNQPDNVVFVEQVVLVEENFIPGVAIEEGETIQASGAVSGSVNGNVNVNGWSVSVDAKLTAIPVMLLAVVLGVFQVI